MKLRSIIVDDESKSRLNLEMLIEEYCPNVQIMGRVGGIEEAVELIDKVRPDVVFLDVRLSHTTGFELLAIYDKRNFDVIFTTAYNEYALKALKAQAIDYILKPIDYTELIAAVDKVLERRKGAANSNYDRLVDGKKESIGHKLQVPFESGIQFIDVNKIVRCQSNDNYSDIFLEGNRKILCTITLLELENRLSAFPFIRIHRSHLINLNCIVKYHRLEGGIVELSDGSKIPIARSRRDEFIRLLNDKNW